MAGNEVRGVEVTSNLTDEVSDDLTRGEVTTDEGTGVELRRGEVKGEGVMWKPATFSFIATLFLSLLF